MTVISRQLVIKVTSINAWNQLTEGVSGAAYSVPTSGSYPRGDMKLSRVINYSSGSVTVAFASASVTPADVASEIWPHYTINPNDQYNDDSVHVIRAGEKLWAKVSADTAGSPTQVVFRASLLECT